MWSSQTCDAGQSLAGSSEMVRKSMFLAAIANIRPSCPPPKMPMVAPGCKVRLSGISNIDILVW